MDDFRSAYHRVKVATHLRKLAQHLESFELEAVAIDALEAQSDTKLRFHRGTVTRIDPQRRVLD